MPNKSLQQMTPAIGVCEKSSSLGAASAAELNRLVSHRETMAYQFAGFFVATQMPKPDSLPQGAKWREIASPFQGVGVLLPHLIGKVVQSDDVQSLAQVIGITGGMTWIFLQYDCWGGEIDFVFGLGVAAGVPFGPVEESTRDLVEAAYTQVMGQFGVSAKAALNFAPFGRGFWGEQ
jgi:hypothetical protein